MRYAIGSQYRDPCSAGVTALHKLNDDLKKLGHGSRVLYMSGFEKIAHDEILVLPDSISGNPYKTKTVIRYLLMYPGYFGNSTQFDSSEMMYYHSTDFIHDLRDPDNILTVPATDETRFPWVPQEHRSGTCYLAKKYKMILEKRPPVDPGWIEITRDTDLEKLFKTVANLVTFDNSAINLEAALCGILVEYRMNPSFLGRISLGDDFHWSDARASYQRLKERYYEKDLPSFIRKTTERFG